MENADPLTYFIAVFTATLTAGLFLLWRRAVSLRDALDGKEGHRLMAIFANIFAVDTLVLGSTAVRTALLFNHEFDLLRQLMGVVTWLMFLGVHFWALLEVRGITRDKRDAQVRQHEAEVHQEVLDAISGVGDKADAAYHEANQVNIKIANLDQRLLEQGERAERDHQNP